MKEKRIKQLHVSYLALIGTRLNNVEFFQQCVDKNLTKESKGEFDAIRELISSYDGKIERLLEERENLIDEVNKLKCSNMTQTVSREVSKETSERAVNQEKFKEIINQMYETYVAKNHDYGNSFDKSLDKFGLVASTVRLGDKMNRIESLQDKANMVPESIRDTLLDMANYAIMTVMWLDNQKK